MGSKRSSLVNSGSKASSSDAGGGPPLTHWGKYRARELGVELHFEHEASPDLAAWSGYDLVIAADGANSRRQRQSGIVVSGAPFPVEIRGGTANLFDAIGREMPFPMRAMFANGDRSAQVCTSSAGLP